MNVCVSQDIPEKMVYSQKENTALKLTTHVQIDSASLDLPKSMLGEGLKKSDIMLSLDNHTITYVASFCELLYSNIMKKEKKGRSKLFIKIKCEN